ncbi:MAG: hypothetical protein ACRDHU_01630 [Actinomycetota bacterium]
MRGSPALRPDVVVPTGIVPLRGYREWALWRDGRGPRLRSLFHPTVWPDDGHLIAACLRPLVWRGGSGDEHMHVPDALCECGIYAFREPEFDTLRGAEGPRARGLVEGWGRFVLGTSGWRCQFASVAALLVDEDDPETSRSLGRRYHVPVLDSLDLPSAVPALGA